MSFYSSLRAADWDITGFTGPSLVVLCSVVVFYLRHVTSWDARARGHPLPPGPKPLPLIGNMLDMPKGRPWVGFRDMCAKYGTYDGCF